MLGARRVLFEQQRLVYLLQAVAVFDSTNSYLIAESASQPRDLPASRPQKEAACGQPGQSVHLTLLTPKQMFLEGSLQASPHSEAGEVIPETLARTGPAHSRRSHSVLTAVDQPTPGWLSGSEQPCTHYAPWRLGQEFKQGLMGMLCLYLGVSGALASGLHSWGYWHRRPSFAGRPGPMLVPGMAGY